jgi:hypothetical protein
MLDEHKLNIPKKRNSQPQNPFLEMERQPEKPETFPSPLQLPERAAEDDKSEVTVSDDKSEVVVEKVVELAAETMVEAEQVEAEQEPAVVEPQAVEMKVEPEVVEEPKESKAAEEPKEMTRPATPDPESAAEIPLPESPVMTRPKSEAPAPLSIATESPAADHTEKPAEPSPTIPGGW